MIQAYLSGYSPYTTQVSVEPGQTSYVEAGLVPLGIVGTLQVISSPGGADLYVDDSYKGKTSLTVENLASGNHPIVLKLFGYQDLTGKTTVGVSMGLLSNWPTTRNTQNNSRLQRARMSR